MVYIRFDAKCERQFQNLPNRQIVLRRDLLEISWRDIISYHTTSSRLSAGLLERYHFIPPPADSRLVFWRDIILYHPQLTLGWSPGEISFQFISPLEIFHIISYPSPADHQMVSWSGAERSGLVMLECRALQHNAFLKPDLAPDNVMDRTTLWSSDK